jgi:hypothetical protein
MAGGLRVRSYACERAALWRLGTVFLGRSGALYGGGDCSGCVLNGLGAPRVGYPAVTAQFPLPVDMIPSTPSRAMLTAAARRAKSEAIFSRPRIRARRPP